MSLNKVPTIKTPTPVLGAVTIGLAIFYFYFTKAETTSDA